jgi:hypothetical protein
MWREGKREAGRERSRAGLRLEGKRWERAVGGRYGEKEERERKERRSWHKETHASDIDHHMARGRWPQRTYISGLCIN